MVSEIFIKKLQSL